MAVELEAAEGAAAADAPVPLEFDVEMAFEPGHAHPTPFIYVGEDVEEGRFPWFATVFTYDEDSDAPSLCGGVLFNPTTIVTAAHCIHDAFRVSIQLHLHDPDIPVFDHKPSREGIEWEVHPRYSPYDFFGDIGVVTIDPVVWAPSVFPEPAIDDGSLWGDTSLTYATVIGHGLTEDNVVSPVLQRTDVPRVAREDCVHSDPGIPTTIDNDESVTWHADVVHQDFCAGWAGGCDRPVPCPDSCSGDSGGPIMDAPTNLVYGVVSRGSSVCGDGRRPAIYTSFAAYRGWFIEKVAPPEGRQWVHYIDVPNPSPPPPGAPPGASPPQGGGGPVPSRARRHAGTLATTAILVALLT